MNVLLPSLDHQFVKLHERAQRLVQLFPADKIYQPPATVSASAPVYSGGEHLLRGAATVEQTFGGITVNLWDDPFEWTLPETLPTAALILEYLSEVEATRRRAFALLRSDEDLRREIILPSGEPQNIAALFFDTLARANYHQGGAAATLRLFSGARLPHI